MGIRRGRFLCGVRNSWSVRTGLLGLLGLLSFADRVGMAHRFAASALLVSEILDQRFPGSSTSSLEVQRIDSAREN
jgi:hypothetical protein